MIFGPICRALAGKDAFQGEHFESITPERNIDAIWKLFGKAAQTTHPQNNVKQVCPGQSKHWWIQDRRWDIGSSDIPQGLRQLRVV